MLRSAPLAQRRPDSGNPADERNQGGTTVQITTTTVYRRFTEGFETADLIAAKAVLASVTGRCRLTLTPSSVRRAGEGPGPWFRHSSRHQGGNLINTPIAVERCGRLLRHRLVARRGIQIRIDRAGLSTWIEEDRLCDRRHLLSIHAVQDGRVLQRNRHA